MTQFHDWEWFTGDVPDGMVQTQSQYQTRYEVEKLPAHISDNGSWSNIIAFRRVKEPFRGEMVLTGYQERIGWFFASQDRSGIDTHRLTLPTNDGALIAGEYIGLGGDVVKVEAIP